MKQSAISEKEYEVIRCIEESDNFNQRLIANKAGISLGLTNLIIKRMVEKGYLKLKQLNPRKIQYILTPKGMTEKVKKSYYFTRRTISTLRYMKEQIQKIILAEYNKGIRDFAICGNGELNNLVEIALIDLSVGGISYRQATKISEVRDDECAIVVSEDNMLYSKNKHLINLMEVLAAGIDINKN